MADDIAKFGVGLDITDAMAKIRRMKNSLQDLNRMQTNLNSVGRGNSGSGRGRGNDPSARNTRFADQLRREERRGQEALGRAMANDIANANRLREQGARTAQRAEQTRLRSLERARSAISNSTIMQQRGATSAQREAQARIRGRVAQARTADEVRSIVANERARLRVMQQQSGVMRRMRQSSNQMMNNMVSAFAVAAGGAFITRTGQDFEAVGNTMLAVSTDAEEAEGNLKFVREEAYRLGLGLKESAKGFAKMNAARGDMSLDDTKAAFTGISEMGTLLGLSSEEGGRAINALMQMMSKGVVSAEELSY